VSRAEVREAITGTHREEWARVVASLTRRFGDLDIAEEAAAEAFAAAVERWPADGRLPSDRFACRPAATTTSSITSRGTEEASTPSGPRRPATTSGDTPTSLPPRHSKAAITTAAGRTDRTAFPLRRC